MTTLYRNSRKFSESERHTDHIWGVKFGVSFCISVSGGDGDGDSYVVVERWELCRMGFLAEVNYTTAFW